jgi:hypothetical protein
LPSIKDIDASITMIRVALSAEKDILWEGTLFRVPPIDSDAARQLLNAFRAEIAKAELNWIVGTIELSQLALELGLIAEGAALIAEVVSGGPQPAELHDVHTICGCCEVFEARREGAVSHLFKSVNVLLETDANIGIRNPAPNVALAMRLLDVGCVGPVKQFLEMCKQCWPRLSDALEGWKRALEVNPTSAAPRKLETFNERNIIGRMACLTVIPRANGLTNEDLRAVRFQMRDAVKGILPSSSN